MKRPDLEGIRTLDPNAVFSLSEAAKLLGITHNGIRGWIHTNRIKYGKCGGRYFIPGAEIQKQVIMPGETELP